MTSTITAAAADAADGPAQVYQRLRSHLAFLKMTAAAEALTGVLDAARDGRLSALEALEQLLGIQAAADENRQTGIRLKAANLPAPWRLADYDYSAQPGIDEALMRELSTLRFLEEAANPIFIGPPGVGKSMLAMGLVRATVEAGHKAHFTTCDQLIRRLKKAAAERRLASALRSFTQPRLLAIDEFGYRTLDEDGRSLLFEVVSARYLKGSITTTSHVGIGAWAAQLGDPMLAAALIDRLLHRGMIVAIDGPSYRMRTHQARAEKLRRATGRTTKGTSGTSHGDATPGGQP